MALGFTKFINPPPGAGEGKLAEVCRGTVTVAAGQRVWLHGTSIAVWSATAYPGEPTLLTFGMDNAEMPNTRHNFGRVGGGPHALPFSVMSAPLTAGTHEFYVLGWYGDYSSVSCHAFIIQ
jgi:hypothetical protein